MDTEAEALGSQATGAPTLFNRIAAVNGMRPERPFPLSGRLALRAQAAGKQPQDVGS